MEKVDFYTEAIPRMEKGEWFWGGQLHYRMEDGILEVKGPTQNEEDFRESEACFNDLSKKGWRPYKPKPELPKFFQCWGVSKNNPKQFGPISTTTKSYCMGEYEHDSEKALLECCYIYDRNGKLIEGEE